MSIPNCTADTTVITNIETTPEERGLTTEQFKAKFDEAPTNIKTDLNENIIPKINEQLSNIVKNNYAATADPTVNDDTSKGYLVGSEWVNTTTGIGYKCMDATNGAAVWKVDAQDYLEGDWTPSFAGETTPGSPAFSLRIGKYIKQGNKVTVWGRCVLTSKGGMAGIIKVTGFPFDAKDIGIAQAGCISQYRNITLGTSMTQIGIHMAAGQSHATLPQSGNNVSPSDTTATQLADSSYIVFNISYII
jgi:hypothetical protein